MSIQKSLHHFSRKTCFTPLSFIKSIHCSWIKTISEERSFTETPNGLVIKSWCLCLSKSLKSGIYLAISLLRTIHTVSSPQGYWYRLQVHFRQYTCLAMQMGQHSYDPIYQVIVRASFWKLSIFCGNGTLWYLFHSSAQLTEFTDLNVSTKNDKKIRKRALENSGCSSGLVSSKNCIIFLKYKNSL